MNLLAAFSACCVAFSLLYYGGATIAAIRFALRCASPPPPLPKIAPRVAMLKPLHGMDENLAGNIESYLELDYPKTEYYFGVSDYEDPAAQAPVAFKARYQFAPITLIVGEEPACENRKVAKLIKMADRAERAEIFVLSDADINVDRNHLRRVVGELEADPKIGAVTCLYRARPNGAFASRLEAMFVNTDFAPMVMVSAAIEPIRYGLGATIAIKRAALDAIGGFRALKSLLADDYFLGKMVADSGYEVRLSTSIVTITANYRSFADFWTHQIRWARTYRTTRPISLAMIFLHGPFWGVMFLLASRFSPPAMAGFAVVIIARIAMGWFMIEKVLKLPELRRDAWLTPLKDLVMTGIWFGSLVSNKVVWGGRQLKILPDGTTREVNG
jgi:ceramide glucosyltransferase